MKRTWQDTFGLVMLASTILFPPCFLVGALFVGLSDYWTRNEKLFAIVVPPVLLVIGLASALVIDSWVIPGVIGTLGFYIAAVVASFTLAFRSGLRDSRISVPA